MRVLNCIGAVGLVCFVAPFVLSAPEDLPSPSTIGSGKLTVDVAAGTNHKNAATGNDTVAPVAQYAGTNQCFTCHRPQTNTWSETKHAHSFTDVPKKYQNDPMCLNCHVTAFGQPGGYVAGTDKDLLMVGCEACHGPGAQHIDAAKRFVLADPGEEAKIEKEMRETIIKTPSDKVCIACHITQAHQMHPAYEGQRPPVTSGPDIHGNPCTPVMYGSKPTAATSSYSPSSKYTVKTCGGCHYDAYKQWRVEKHSDLFAMLPAKYQSDQSCVSCHQNAGSLPKSPSGQPELHHNRVGLACESCHGPAHRARAIQ